MARYSASRAATVCSTIATMSLSATPIGGRDELHEQAAQLGALRLLDKPCDLDELAHLAGPLGAAAAQ